MAFLGSCEQRKIIALEGQLAQIRANTAVYDQPPSLVNEAAIPDADERERENSRRRHALRDYGEKRYKRDVAKAETEDAVEHIEAEIAIARQGINAHAGVAALPRAAGFILLLWGLCGLYQTGGPRDRAATLVILLLLTFFLLARNAEDVRPRTAEAAKPPPAGPG
jgi:hypothetical protein